jgi:hypothetical protein
VGVLEEKFRRVQIDGTLPDGTSTVPSSVSEDLGQTEVNRDGSTN